MVEKKWILSLKYHHVTFSHFKMQAEKDSLERLKFRGYLEKLHGSHGFVKKAQSPSLAHHSL
jgi:hypothetical protein